MPEVPVLRILLQPFVKVLFRTEEIIDRSATTPLDEDRRRVHFDNLAVEHFNVDQIRAVGAGIFNLDGYARFKNIVADQQQEVNRSPDIEFVFTRHIDGVIVVP